MNNGARRPRRRERCTRNETSSKQLAAAKGRGKLVHVCTMLQLAANHAPTSNCMQRCSARGLPLFCPLHRPMPGLDACHYQRPSCLCELPRPSSLRLAPPPCTLAPLKSTIALGGPSQSPAIFLNHAPSVVWLLLHVFFTFTATRAPSTC